MNFKDLKNFKNSKCFLKRFGAFRQIERALQARFGAGISLSLSLSLVSFLFVIHFLNPLNLFTRFSLFLRQKFINFARKFSQKFTKFTQNSNKFINSASLRTSRKAKCGNPLSKVGFVDCHAKTRLRSFLLAMTAISTPNAFKISKNSTQRNSYE